MWFDIRSLRNDIAFYHFSTPTYSEHILSVSTRVCRNVWNSRDENLGYGIWDSVGIYCSEIFFRGERMSTVKEKVKCTFVQALRLYIGHTAHRGSRGLAVLFLDHGTRRG